MHVGLVGIGRRLNRGRNQEWLVGLEPLRYLGINRPLPRRFQTRQRTMAPFLVAGNFETCPLPDYGQLRPLART